MWKGYIERREGQRDRERERECGMRGERGKERERERERERGRERENVEGIELERRLRIKGLLRVTLEIECKN